MKLYKWLVIALSLFLVLTQLNIFVVDAENWFDVSFSLQTAYLLNENGWGSIQFSQYDVHSPVYYYVLAGWQRLNPGLSEYHWARELSVLLGLLFIVFVFFGLRKLYRLSGEIATVFLAACATYVHFATEVRMYMLVLLYSAIVFWAVMHGLERRVHRWLAYGALMLSTMTHYFAGMMVPFFLVLYFLVMKKRRLWGIETRRRLVRMALWGFAGLLVALCWAIPQRVRVDGAWFQAPSPLSFISAAFYAFFPMDELMLPLHGVSVAIYVLFVGVVVGLMVYGVWRVFRGVLLDREGVLLLMGMTMLFPLVLLLFLSTLNGSFSNLYHHRFFLVVTWMFAAMLFVLVAENMVWWSVSGKRLWWVLLLVVVGVIVVMDALYVAGSHHELERMMVATPCVRDGFVLVGHESPFSSLPYEVWGRMHGCRWHSFIWTEVTRGMANGGGFDAIYSSQVVYWGGELPKDSFYYVESTAKEFPLEAQGREFVVVAEDEGIRLLFVLGVTG